MEHDLLVFTVVLEALLALVVLSHIALGLATLLVTTPTLMRARTCMHVNKACMGSALRKQDRVTRCRSLYILNFVSYELHYYY